VLNLTDLRWAFMQFWLAQGLITLARDRGHLGRLGFAADVPKSNLLSPKVNSVLGDQVSFIPE
jgi:hypothetical protein